MNVAAFLTKTSQIFPDKVAISYGEWKETYSDLNHRTNRLASSLLDLGMKKGDRVSLFQNNSAELVESIFGCFKAGLTAVPVNARLASPELEYVVAHSGSQAVIFSDSFLSIVDGIRSNLHDDIRYIITGKTTADYIEYENMITEGSNDLPDRYVGGDDIAWLFYTSGTTGYPKGAMLSHHNLIAMTMNFLSCVYPATHQDIGLHIAPLTHGSGLYMLPLIAKGAHNVIGKWQSFDPRKVLISIQQNRATVLPFVVPTIVKRLVQTENFERYDVSSLKCIIYGGAPALVADLVRAVKYFGKILVQIYGQGEAPMSITVLQSDDHSSGESEREMEILSSAGTPQTGVEVRVVNDAVDLLQFNQVGEIAVRGDVVMKGYWNDENATNKTLKNGWLLTGDLGYFDKSGYLFLVDRKKDMIITGGSNVYSREVEEVIIRHPGVDEVTVIGVPDDMWGEAVKAVVVLKSGSRVTEREIIDFCSGKLSNYKKPKSVDFVAEIPKNAYGKPLRREVREKYWKGQERRVH